MIIQPNRAVINYNDIGMIYIVTSTKVYIPYISFALYNGDKYYLCDNVNDDEFVRIMKHCFERNPKILIGNTKENIIDYKEYVRDFKAGNTYIVQRNPYNLDEDIDNVIFRNIFQSRTNAIPRFHTPFEFTKKGGQLWSSISKKCYYEKIYTSIFCTAIFSNLNYRTFYDFIGA